MDKINKLSELKNLLDNGVLTQEEFDKIKADLISGKKDDSVVEPIAENESMNTNAQQVVEEVFVDKNERENSKILQDKKSEKDYVKDLEETKTNHSYGRYILSIILFVGFVGVTSYNFYFKEKWAKEEQIAKENGNTRFTYLTEPVDDLESYSVTGISNEQELYQYLDEVATYWCSEFKKAKKYNNKNRRFEEMLMVDRCINAYPLGFQEGIIMLNDLPMELCSKAREYFQKKVIELGYEPNWDEDSSEITSSLEEQIETHERGSSSEYDEAEYNRQQEQAEYESSQAYYNSENENSSKTYKDQSGNSFKSVKIGNQSWMGTNLNVDKFRNGDPIPQAKTAEEWVKAGENRQPAWCFYNNDPSNGKKYGKLYNQYAVNDPRGLAPIGWHIPKEAEWKILVDYHGGRQNAGKKMKGTSGWSNSGNGNNEFDFNVLASGVRSVTGQFHYINEKTNFWCSTNNSYTNPHLILQNFSIGIYDGNGQPNSAFSVRCIKD